MHVDDRLDTVLRTRAGGLAAARIQYRQLLDLIGTLPSEARGASIDAGFVRMAELSRALPAADRAAALTEPGLRLRSPRLLAELANAEPVVAEAAMRAARLDEAQWLDLIPALPITVRSLVRHRRDLGPAVEAQLARLGIGARALPPAEASAQQPRPAPPVAACNDDDDGRAAPATDAPAATRISAIGEIVERIEEFRKRRASGGEAAIADPAAPRLPLGDAAAPALAGPSGFSFATDEAGRISWADSHVAPMVVGMALAASGADPLIAGPPELAAAFRRRQPLHALPVTVAGAPPVAGDWRLDATPGFNERGRFTGYVGRFRRSMAAPLRAQPRADSGADRIRQLLHELRTPVNAIQGFAEVIQQQLFGPAAHDYRAHAASIAADAARMLSGFDDLDRLARLDSAALALEPGHCDLADIVRGMAGQLATHAAQRGGTVELVADDGIMAVAIDRAEAERLVWRLLAALAGSAAPGEALRLRLRAKHGHIRLTASLPAALSAQEDLFHSTAPAPASVLSASMFGTGFALRLAASEARSCGGSLERRGEKLRLELPAASDGLTGPVSAHTQNQGNAA